ncbi:MAG: hypothetical protein BWY14_00529 [Parcubacteria group bacterium ADurb.Bin192]|nr:MAG: hypothetical protein BWY14_00529 [Parcubacteria group bacterium ADurb.Bin192]
MPMRRRLFNTRQGRASLLGLWRRIFFGESSSGQAKSEDSPVNKNRQKYLAAGIMMAVFGVFLVAFPANADMAGNLVNWIIAIFTKVLVYIMELLGYILIQLVDFLIQIVQFNNFVKAAPVRIGWPILRDTVNMFFIIVVLVSAFATIIGYPKEFHYRQILPKLLLMAILINFSKTLIGLMIDFSQVVVLTFVNGFKAAAGGNFINALHIREVMNINTKTGPIVTQVGDEIKIDAGAAADDGVTIYQIFNMMLAAIFGIWLLSISITLIIIMVVFFLARIIILWFLLITSPVMFFAWALPGKLQKAFSAFTDQWWNRLSSALIGGPVMAFFLWLSLAMAQGGSGPDALVGDGQSAIYSDTKRSSEVQGVETAFKAGDRLGSIVVTEIGDAKTFSNFIIMVAFMLLGVQVAVQSSQALSPKLGGLARSISDTGGMMGMGVAGTVLGASLARKGASWAGGQVDKRYGIKSGAARMALGAIQKTGVPVGVGTRMALARTATEHQVASKKRASEMKDAFGNLPPSMQMREYDNLANGRLSKYFGVKANKMAAVQNMATLAGSVPFMKSQQNEERDAVMRDAVKNNRFKGKKTYDELDTDQKLAVDTEARQRVDSKVADILERGNKFATDNNMTELQDQIKQAREKNPALFANVKQKSDVSGKMSSDPEAERKLQDDAFMDMAFTVNFLRGKGFMDNDGNLTVDPVYDEDFKQIMRGRQGQLIGSTLDFMNTDEGKKRAKALLSNKAEDKDNATLNVSADGKNYSVLLQPGNAKDKPQVLSYSMGGVAMSKGQVTDGVSSAKITALESELTRGGRTLEQVGMRLGNDKRAEELTNNLSTLNSSSAAAAQKADARANIMQKGLMTASGLFGVDDKGDFSGTGQVDYDDTVRSAYGNIKAGVNTEANVRIIANSLSGAKGQALATHGAALQSGGYEALRKAIQQSSGEQKRALQEGLREIMNQAAVAMREQASGNSLNATQQQYVDTAEWLKGSGARSDQDQKAVRSFQALMRGKGQDFSS